MKYTLRRDGLTINDVSYRDQGLVKCQADNGVNDIIEAHALLKIKGVYIISFSVQFILNN